MVSTLYEVVCVLLRGGGVSIEVIRFLAPI